MIRGFKNSNLILSVFLFGIMTAYVVFVNDFNFTNSILKSVVLILLFVFLCNNYLIIEKLKSKETLNKNNFSKTNNIDSIVTKSPYDHLLSEIFTNPLKGTKKLVINTPTNEHVLLETRLYDFRVNF